MADGEKFTFEISLSVLNHLGRNLYRSFATVLGEAISNSWDADAENVLLYINKDQNSFYIKDDGVGMNAEDFQEKFLKVGYSKRKDGKQKSDRGRPFIGRKGIGKLALLSCAERIVIVSKTEGGDYIGGVIDNRGLDEAIEGDLTPDEYLLEEWTLDTFQDYVEGHSHGTIIYFEDIKGGIRNSLAFLKKILALYFKFSLYDNSFNIFVDDELVDYRALAELAAKTQFLWTINGYEDPYLADLTGKFTEEKNRQKNLTLEAKITGFIASVEKPKDLSILSMGERVGIDLFVNGRMRERNILKHIPTAQIPESYLYGQIHYDELDAGDDRFTSSREGIVADDPMYEGFLEFFRREILLKVVEDWDVWRGEIREDGDSENKRVSRKERKAGELFNAVSAEYDLPKESPNSKKVTGWIDSLQGDAKFNLSSYAECFVSENLVRNFVEEKKLALTDEAKGEVEKFRKREEDSKGRGNLSIDIRQRDSDLGYLSMDDLANLVDKGDKVKDASLARDAYEYKPVRDAVAHTALLTDVAKAKLTSVYENIKARVRKLLEE